jgi:hypothetical protein
MHKWSSKTYTVKTKKSPTGKIIRKGYTVKGHCSKTKTAWMTMVAELWKTQRGSIKYSECLDWAKDIYGQYKKTHTQPSGQVRISYTDIRAAIARELRKR